MASRKPLQRYLETGDLLKTHPFEGYWGCAVVLTSRGSTKEFDPMCHIGITTLVHTHDFRLDELDISKLEVLTRDVNIRVGPNQYTHLRRETCIGIYASKVNTHVHVLGRVDASRIYPHPLTYAAGDGTGRGWPMCGRVVASLGFEAVGAWRSIHDRENWEKECAAARESTDEMFSRLARQSREKRTRKRDGA